MCEKPLARRCPWAHAWAAGFSVQGVSVIAIHAPFTAASSRKPAAVQALAGHRIAELCVAITQARAAVGKPKIPRQAPAAALTIDVLAAGALPRHLVAQRAHRALRVALAWVAAVEAKAVAACSAGVAAASHDVGFAVTLPPESAAAGVQRPLGIALACCQWERKSNQARLKKQRGVTVLIILQFCT